MAVKTTPRSIDENIGFLRKIISVDTLLEEINQEEALEFLEALENDFSQLRSKHEEEIEELNEKLDSLKWADLLERVKENLDDDKAEELLEVITDHDEDLVNDSVAGKGYLYVKVNTMMDEEKLRNFLEKELYPSYNEQQANILF
jgi:hypothetical protein